MTTIAGTNWMEVPDADSGQSYYYNTVTGETSWTMPAEVSGSTQVWEEKLDPSSGLKYYYNVVTQETTWECPPDFVPPSALVAASGEAEPDSAANWTVGVDPTTEKKYYYNIITQATQWECPACLAEEPGVPEPLPPVQDMAISEPVPEPTPEPVPEPPAQPAIEPVVQPPPAPEPVPDSPKKTAVAPPPILNRPSALQPPPPRKTTMPVIPETTETTATTLTTESTESDSAPAPEVKPSPPKPAMRSKAESFAALRALEASTNEEAAAIVAPSTQVEAVKESADDSATHTSSLMMFVTNDDKTTEELIQQVNGITLEQYAEKFFNFDRKGFFKSRTTMDKILSWKPDLIKAPLRNLTPEIGAEACQLFRNVTGFMGDRSTAKNVFDHAAKMLNSMLLAPEELRDELYCQICKQTNHNPSAQNTERGWHLFLISLATFPPSTELMPHLMAYCVSNLTNENPNVAKFAEIALHRIPKVCRLGPRREIPTKIEMDSLMHASTPVVRVFFLDDKYIMLRVDSWTTAKDLHETICRKLNLTNSKPFALFEVSNTDEERALDADERILDLIAFWNRQTIEEMHKAGKHGEIEEFHFLFKVALFLDIDDTDQAAVEMMYVQAIHDVVDARYPCSDQDAITLAALQMQEEFGDCPGPDCNYLGTRISHFICRRLIEDKDPEELEKGIIALYEKLTGYTQMEARLSYLDYIKSWKIYGSTYFIVEPQNNPDLPKEAVLAVNNKGILVVDPASKEFLAEYDYANVVTWGHSANSFVVVTGNTNKQVKVYFKTDQGKEINNMIRAYVESRMG